MVCLRNGVFHHLTMETNHSSISKVPSLKSSENTLFMNRKKCVKVPTVFETNEQLFLNPQN